MSEAADNRSEDQRLAAEFRATLDKLMSLKCALNSRGWTVFTTITGHEATAQIERKQEL